MGLPGMAGYENILAQTEEKKNDICRWFAVNVIPDWFLF